LRRQLVLNGPEVKQRSSSHQLDKSIRGDARHRDHDVAADNGNLGFGHTQTVNAFADDLLSLLDLHVSDRLTGRNGLRRQDDLRAAAEIKTKFRRQGVTGPKGPCRKTCKQHAQHDKRTQGAWVGGRSHETP
jgi:hypothetical protein